MTPGTQSETTRMMTPLPPSLSPSASFLPPSRQNVFPNVMYFRFTTNQPGQPWSPNLEHALYNRTVRMSIYCNNVNFRQDGYVLFKVGNGESSFDLSVADYEFILDPSSAAASARHAGPRGAVGGGWVWALFSSLVVVGVSSSLTLVAP